MRGGRAVRAAVLAGAAAAALAGCAPVYTAGSSATVEPARASPGGGASAAPPAGPSAELAEVLGTLVWPLALDGASLLSSPYGDRVHPVASDVRFHSGLDLRAPAGTPVHAAADGVVLASGTAGAYGQRVILDHGAGLRSLYAHHSRNLVVAGQRVRRGQVIALVGRTGNATGDHLHFELHWRDGVVDPKVVLPALARAPRR